MTPIADMVEQMLAMGAPHAVIVLAIRTAEGVTLASRDALRDASHDERSPAAIRSARYRQKLKENQGATKANDVVAPSEQSVTAGRDARRDGVTAHCDLSSSFLDSKASEKEERKGETVSVVDRGARTKPARGTRLEPAATLSDADRQFARDLGMSAAAIDQAWAEFVDYWIGVPGQRGTKLNWPATWRNRVRSITAGAVNSYERHRKSGAPAAARPRAVAQDAIVAGMVAALSERPDSRLGGGCARGRGAGEAGNPNDRPQLGPVAGSLLDDHGPAGGTARGTGGD